MESIKSSDNPYVKTHLVEIPDVIVKSIIRIPNTLISSSRSTQVDGRQNIAIKLNLKYLRFKEGNNNSLTYSKLFLTLVKILLLSSEFLPQFSLVKFHHLTSGSLNEF